MSKLIQRNTCYSCYRPRTSCMCEYIHTVKTNTKFVILMHPKEFRKTKNGTGHFTNLSLKNSEIFIGIDFSNDEKINKMINDENNSCYLLYPSDDSIKLNTQTISTTKQNIVFILDSTWPCSRKMLRLSKNLQKLTKISFVHSKSSAFKIKTQPNDYCLSTIESTLCVLELLNKHGIENIKSSDFDTFLMPFEKMVEYQVECSKEKQIRFR